MNILSIKDVAKIGREKPLFTGVTFGLNEGDKAALIGRNGTGKSTLLSVIAGVLTPDEGNVVINKESGVSYLPQNPVFNKEDTIRSHIFKSETPALLKIRKYMEACALMETDHCEKTEKLFAEAGAEMDRAELWNYESRISSVLTTLGIDNLDKKMGELSGGMVKKVSLAQVLVEDTKLLLLDEPTNHLDISTITFLQDYLAETKRSVLMVTHDRYFLDAVCNHIYELNRNKVKLYVGNYSAYLEKKEIESEIEENTERRIESVLRFERDWLLRGPCARGTKAKARIQHDMALINREKFHDPEGFSFHVEGRRLGGKILEIKNISKSFKDAAGEKKVINDFSYTFSRGDKIGIFGNNGSGKSTLLNLITGRLVPDSGTVSAGENTAIAYYEQNPQFKNQDMTVLEYVKEAAEVMKTADGTELSAALFLEQFGFEGRIQHSPLLSLSGGERKRLFLVRLLLSNPNFLILDEPTNDFDIFTMNVLERFLMDFKGCLLVVSHDRYFMDKVSDSLFIMEEDGSISGYAGKCSEYIEYKKQLDSEKEAQKKLLRAEKAASAVQTASASAPAPAKKKRSFKEQKEFESLEEEIALLEEKMTALESEMSGTDYEKVRIAGEEYKKTEELLAGKYERWEVLAELE
ncbi:MAG: ABC-F family ATP-binding cassette domain-containing protein [Treponema sp.]|nr:ABC-F family ATP-binding cassette domain-containing protein [Treponema sp.]